jgi:3-phosphoshikimate 1-carboxyvinyltransferase
MTERPIKVLVEALEQLGAKISYEKRSGLSYSESKVKNNRFQSYTIAANVAVVHFGAIVSGSKIRKQIELTLDG